jgi:hypothetical protein
MAQKKPTLLRRLINFTIAYIKYYVSGCKDVDSNTYIKRLDTCLRCENLDTLNECAVCGCPIFDKAKMKTEKCPINKWN